jgi:hypothetical protein
MPLFYYKGKIMTYATYCAKIKAAFKRIKPHLRLLKYPLPTIPEVDEESKNDVEHNHPNKEFLQ